MENNNRTLVIETLSYDYGVGFGFQEFLFNILKYIQAHRTDLNYEFVKLACKKSDRKYFAFLEPEISIVDFDISGQLKKYWVLNTLGRQMKLRMDDVILFTNNYSSLTKQCKHVLVIHDLLYLRKKFMPNRLFRIQRSLFVPRSIKIADKVIAISNWVKSDIEKNFGITDFSKVVAIYNYFDFNRYKVGTVAENVTEYVNKNEYFLAVSANAKHKNLITIFKAFEKFAKISNKGNLVLVGKLRGDIKEYYDSMPDSTKNRIKVFYNISNASLGYLYRNARAFISATLFEGLGMPLVEAMFFDKPTIASDIDVVKEVTLNKAHYFQSYDVEQLCKMMLTDYPEEHVSEQIEKLYSEDNTIRQYVNLMNSL